MAALSEVDLSCNHVCSGLSKLWEEHTAHECKTRDAERTLDTMVDDAYLNHVPVMTGGRGKTELRAFYSADFIPKMPLRTPNSRRSLEPSE
jgi:hypothetical protein